MTTPADTPDPLHVAAELRRQVASIVAQLDTRPWPDHINPRDHRLPGPVWHPDPAWTVRCVDRPDDDDPAVFITTPDAMFPTDFRALPIAAARRFAAAVLAACDHAERRRDGVVMGGWDMYEADDCTRRSCPPPR